MRKTTPDRRDSYLAAIRELVDVWGVGGRVPGKAHVTVTKVVHEEHDDVY